MTHILSEQSALICLSEKVLPGTRSACHFLGHDRKKGVPIFGASNGRVLDIALNLKFHLLVRMGIVMKRLHL